MSLLNIMWSRWDVSLSYIADRDEATFSSSELLSISSSNIDGKKTKTLHTKSAKRLVFFSQI